MCVSVRVACGRFIQTCDLNTWVWNTLCFSYLDSMLNFRVEVYKCKIEFRPTLPTGYITAASVTKGFSRNFMHVFSNQDQWHPERVRIWRFHKHRATTPSSHPISRSDFRSQSIHVGVPPSPGNLQFRTRNHHSRPCPESLNGCHHRQTPPAGTGGGRFPKLFGNAANRDFVILLWDICE